jgi:DNA-binding NarL/FixJ family response regulator
MSKSASLRSAELRRVRRLLGECRELGDDALAWNRHMLQGLRQLVGARIGTLFEMRAGASQAGVTFSVDLGWATAKDRNYWFQNYVVGEAFQRMDTVQRFFAIPGRLVTRSRTQLVEDHDWYRSYECNEIHRPLQVTDLLASCQRLPDESAVYCFCLSRHVGDPPFGAAQRRLIDLFHRALSRDFGGLLQRQPGGLFGGFPQHLQATLRCLLEGDSEKQVALRLGLSRFTVHDYTSDLYRRFEVSSRAELLARCYRYCGPLLPPNEGRAASDLSPRLQETLRCLLEGDSEKQAARRLDLSRHTVHEYVTDLYRRFGVNSRSELVAFVLGHQPTQHRG